MGLGSPLERHRAGAAVHQRGAGRVGRRRRRGDSALLAS